LTNRDDTFRDKFRTQNTPLIGRVSYVLRMPATLWYIAQVADALTALSIDDNWEQGGTVSISDATEAATLMLEGFQPMIGWLWPIATATVPDNMLLCDGATYNRVDYPDLYAALDAAFIIDADTFVVPDLIDRVPVGSGNLFAVGEMGGEVDHTLDTTEIPSHQHSIDGYIPGVALTPGELPVLTDVAVPSGTGFTGGGAAHNNMQPFQAMKWGIVAT